MTFHLEFVETLGLNFFFVTRVKVDGVF